jgi:serine/threonine protein kinase
LLSRPELAPRIGRFELLALLGQGGTGPVYEARDERDGSSVALKWLNGADARAVARFKAEFRAIAELAHDNLVPDLAARDLCAQSRR